MIFGASMNFLTPFQVHLGISGKSRKWHKYVGLLTLSIATFGAPVGSLYFSMLSPAEWGGRAPHPFEGSYRLEADMSWTPAEEIAERDASRRELLPLLPR